MSLKGFKLKPKTPQISKECFEAKFRGRFSRVQQVNLKKKMMCTSPGYLSIDTFFFRKLHRQITEEKIAVNLYKKKPFHMSRVTCNMSLTATAGQYSLNIKFILIYFVKKNCSLFFHGLYLFYKKKQKNKTTLNQFYLNRLYIMFTNC